MKTLLVLAPHPELADAMRAGLNPEHYRVIHRSGAEEADPLLAHGLADACILDLELSGVQGLWLIEKLRRRVPRCPLIIYSGTRQADWEEEAYLQGVKQVLSKPFRARLLNTVLESLFATAKPVAAPVPARPFETSYYSAPEATRSSTANLSGTSPLAAAQSLAILRDFSAILSHSLKADALLKQFLLLIREITGVNRAAIFLRPGIAPQMPGHEQIGQRELVCSCAIGLSPDLLANVQLSTESGVGGQAHRVGRILRRNSPEVADTDSQREFELLSAQVAIPILDREQVIGVAMFDTRVTGEPLANPELEMIFHLLEQVGLAVKNIWLHDQIVSNHQMLADIMRELGSACVVVSRDLAVIHANKTARKLFGQTGARAGELDFSDLPPALGSKVFQVLKTGSGVSPFRYTPEDVPGAAYQVTVVPIIRGDAAVPSSALLMVEDRTQLEQLQKLEVEAKNLRLIRSMSERLAAEIGNAMVPVSVHQQLIAERFKDAEFRAALDKALADGVKRVDRLVHQMRYLAGGVTSIGDAIPVEALIEEAYQEARKYQPGKAPKLNVDYAGKPVAVTGDRNALKHALCEVILNALQSNPASPEVVVRCSDTTTDSGAPEVKIEIEDNGPGFTSESQKEATTPFFTTRIPGVGLGLAVTRKIVESHRGKLEIPGPYPGKHGVVAISLPVASVPSKR
jgi:signal transduction histidine kinase/DNA-binding response OmpR family regulator